MNNSLDIQDKDKEKTQDSFTALKSFLKEKKLVILALVLLLIVLTTAVLLLVIKPPGIIKDAIFAPPPDISNPDLQTDASPQVTIGAMDTSPTDKEIVARVGQENIYRKSLETLILNGPRAQGVDYQKIFTDKLIEESIILQSAGKAKLATLDSSVYNSETMDLDRRSLLVKQIKDIIDNKAEKIEGSVVSIWFYNVTLGSLGFEGGKKFTFEKISLLQRQVKDGLINIREAGEKVKNDTSLAQVDKNYYYNAIFDFSSSKGGKISFDDSFNQVLWSLKEGETSDVYLLKDKIVDTGKMADAVYMFGQVTKKTYNSGFNGFDVWYNENKKLYEIRYL